MQTIREIAIEPPVTAGAAAAGPDGGAGTNNGNDDDDDCAPPMHADATANEFLELARYNDEGAAARIAELAAGQPALVDVRDSLTGRTALHMAASNGHAELVRVLLALPGAVVDVRALGSQATPLHDAVLTNNAAIVTALLAAGASASAQCDGGDTPLSLAERLGFDALSAVLLRADATIDSYQTPNGAVTMSIDDSELSDAAAAGGEESSTPVSAPAAAAAAAAAAGTATCQPGVAQPATRPPVNVDDVE
jgi:hypothetical protein